ncbi:MAG: hypothetical protein K8R77_06085 [Anaerolineaceae bacterium]|nr:hypothetical protein [Anaerolineaceae bacterium]
MILITCIVVIWVWRVGYLVSKARINRLVSKQLRPWAAVAWPVTVTLWAFIGSSQVAADWVEQLLPGDTEGPEALEDLLADGDVETTIEEEAPAELLETIPD